jgi:hypothetical protein
MGKLIMGERERVRVKLLEMVVQKKISLKEVSIKMKVSYRQAKGIYKRYCQEGDTRKIDTLLRQVMKC